MRADAAAGGETAPPRARRALVSTADDRGSGVLRVEALVWVGNRHDDAGGREPLQLALGDPDTLDHRAAREGLDAVARP